MTYKQGDIHPTKNMIFWSYKDKFHLKEHWCSPDVFKKRIEYRKKKQESEEGKIYRKKYYNSNKDRVNAKVEECRQKSLEKHSLRYLLTSIKSGATKRKMKFEIDLEFINELWEKQSGKCFYTGLAMRKVAFKKSPFQVSIDQKECGKGYTKENAVLCCQSINFAKNSYTESDFLDFINALKTI